MRFSRIYLFAAVAGATSVGAVEPELYTFHCLWGCPVGAPATNDVLVREIYTLSNNDFTKLADWVAYRVTPQTIAASRDDRDYRIDPWLSPSETLGEPEYDDASSTLRIDHGHQAPLAAFSGTQQWNDTNFNSNMTPQGSTLNRGPWQRLEGWERSATLKTQSPVYVITGPLFERLMRPMPKGPAFHRVPSGYWKVIATADGRMTAFIMDQNTPQNGKHCDYRVPLLQVQLRSRLVLFPARPDGNAGSLDELLGCTSPAPAIPIPSEIQPR